MVSLGLKRALPLIPNEMFHVVLERGRISTFASKMQVNLVLSYSSKMSKPEMSCYRPAPQNFSLFFWGGGQREDIQIH